MFLKRDYRNRAWGLLGALALLLLALVINNAHEGLIKAVVAADAAHAVKMMQKTDGRCDPAC
jgi:hypothetical protein